MLPHCIGEVKHFKANSFYSSNDIYKSKQLAPAACMSSSLISGGSEKRRIDEHHPALLRHFASLVLLYKTLDLLAYLGMFLLGPFKCYADLLW